MTHLLLALIAILPTCATEDSTMCYWEASASGNGTGSSYIAITDNIRIITIKGTS